MTSLADREDTIRCSTVQVFDSLSSEELELSALVESCESKLGVSSLRSFIALVATAVLIMYSHCGKTCSIIILREFSIATFDRSGKS